MPCSVGRAIVEVSMGDAGSKEKKPTHCGWAQEASQKRWLWVGCIGDVQEEGGGSSVPKEQQVKRPRVGEQEAEEPLMGAGGLRGAFPGRRWGVRGRRVPWEPDDRRPSMAHGSAGISF